ncbi:MAG: leucyl aminopeptidase, partial [Cyanobacteria bacterium P01_F01_bin.116]
MKFVASDKSCLTWSGDCLVVGLSEESLPLTGLLSDLNDQVSGLLQELIDETEFKAKTGSSAVIRVGGSVRKLAIVGLGAAEDLKLEGLRRAAAVAAKLAKREKCASLGISFPIWNNSPERTAQTIAEGVILAMHEDKRFKSDADTPNAVLSDIALLDLPGHEAALETATHVCDGVILARELVAAPPNVVTPMTLAETAETIANDYGLTLKVLEKAECEELGMGAYLGVAMASEMPPKFIHLTYTPSGTPKRKIALIGKGLTFDSGGLNIKAGAGSMIELMKMDMGGAAAVLGAAKAIAQIKPDVEVHFISAATENMISGHAMHPGDILTASNGKTIEVNNTDAEGRLTLADALVYADKLGVDAMVDLATLTG